MKLIWLISLSFVLLEVCLGFDADLMAKLEKELQIAEVKSSSKSALTSMNSATDMASLMKKLESELKDKNDQTKQGKSGEDFASDMERLEREMEEASKKAAKRNIEQSLDEFMDEIKNGGKDDEEEKRTFKDKFYKIIGYEKKEATMDDDKALRKMMLKRTLSDILNDLSGKSSSSSKRELTSNDDTTCVDKRTDCKNLLDYCDLKGFKEKLKGVCAKSCRYCRVCENTISESGCKLRQHLCYAGNYVDRMRDICYKTCGYCKAPAPPKCSKTNYGCCWNKETTKQDADGTNCPSCIDKYRHACGTFEEDCFSPYLPGQFMRRNCPKICGLCSGVCIDSPEYATQCRFWKKDLNWCKDPLHRENMRHLCPKTCEFC